MPIAYVLFDKDPAQWRPPGHLRTKSAKQNFAGSHTISRISIGKPFSGMGSLPRKGCMFIKGFPSYPTKGSHVFPITPSWSRGTIARGLICVCIFLCAFYILSVDVFAITNTARNGQFVIHPVMCVQTRQNRTA